MKYVLNWNDEYLDMQIVSGPSSEETAREEMKKAVIEGLVRFGMETDERAAEARYLAAENVGANEEEQELHVSTSGASIIYGGGYEDRYQIVDYGQDDGKMPERRKSKYYKDVKNGRGTNLTINTHSYLSVGPKGTDIMIRGVGKVIAFDCWEDLIGAIDTGKATYHNCDPGMDSLG